ncbi:DUF2931 family protein [Chryseobacterium sp. PBS4-4]|uniref:DUF2931 family protein n=1 Tax=Chryseobacterium edaphi TaxID=2976532 RepID=A0ABT2W6Y8_9FLAO|nr:DUF2931 family protein [Chryseobacterium edaphi]MCU7617714.1 DUF2931 family protein [Chryseobacterium edaphi]
MKKNLKILLTKENTARLFWLLMISLSFLQSCNKKKYRWEPGISAPKYYPVGDIRVSFGNAGNGSTINIDPGWGETYGSVVGEKWKNVPREVLIHYASCAENYTYEGKVLLPQEKIRDLFNEYNLDDEDNLGHLVVGMASGGWIRVWFQALDQKANEYVNIEVVKAKLNGSYDNTANERYKVKNFENWGKYYTYWQNHGIPYEAWANNEKVYDMYFDFNKPNKREIEFSYTTQDGTFEQGIGIWKKFHKKLPVEMELGWRGKSKEIFYCSKVIIPKGFKNLVKQKSLETIIFRLEIENDDVHANLYLVSKGIKEKILRFRNVQPTEKEKKDNEYAYATEVEYFIP